MHFINEIIREKMRYLNQKLIYNTQNEDYFYTIITDLEKNIIFDKYIIYKINRNELNLGNFKEYIIENYNNIFSITNSYIIDINLLIIQLVFNYYLGFIYEFYKLLIKLLTKVMSQNRNFFQKNYRKLLADIIFFKATDQVINKEEFKKRIDRDWIEKKTIFHYYILQFENLTNKFNKVIDKIKKLNEKLEKYDYEIGNIDFTTYFLEPTDLIILYEGFLNYYIYDGLDSYNKLEQIQENLKTIDRFEKNLNNLINKKKNFLKLLIDLSDEKIYRNSHNRKQINKFNKIIELYNKNLYYSKILRTLKRTKNEIYNILNEKDPYNFYINYFKHILTPRHIHKNFKNITNYKNLFKILLFNGIFAKKLYSLNSAYIHESISSLKNIISLKKYSTPFHQIILLCLYTLNRNTESASMIFSEIIQKIIFNDINNYNLNEKNKFFIMIEENLIHNFYNSIFYYINIKNTKNLYDVFNTTLKNLFLERKFIVCSKLIGITYKLNIFQDYELDFVIDEFNKKFYDTIKIYGKEKRNYEDVNKLLKSLEYIAYYTNKNDKYINAKNLVDSIWIEKKFNRIIKGFEGQKNE